MLGTINAVPLKPPFAAVALVYDCAAGFPFASGSGSVAVGALYIQGFPLQGWARSCWSWQLHRLRRVALSDSSFWNVTVPRVLTTYALVIFAMLWVGFAIALVVDREWLDLLWNWVRALPIVVEIIVWVLFLPIMVALWIWESSWPFLVRLLGFAGIVGWTLLAVYSFFRDVR